MSEAAGSPVEGGRACGWRRPWRGWRQEAEEGEARLPRVGAVVGGLRLLARLGEGSHGTVFRARRGGRLYAVKFLYLPRVGEWGWRELEVLLRVRRLGLLRVEGHGLWPDRSPRFLYLVLEYVRGCSLYDWARLRNPTARQVARMMRELVRQVVAMHSAGVVHRDIKGANVLVREVDGLPVLVDFGVGTWPGALQVTQPFTLPGTSLYRSPEALRFRRERAAREPRSPVRPLDDLWALGVVLYWLLTGLYPFEGLDEGTLADAILHHSPEPPHLLNPRVPQALGALCRRLLEKAAEARYPDAAALGLALDEVLARADAAWDVPLGQAYGPDNATTPVEGALSLEEALARFARLEGQEKRHLRRGLRASSRRRR